MKNKDSFITIMHMAASVREGRSVCRINHSKAQLIED